VSSQVGDIQQVVSRLFIDVLLLLGGLIFSEDGCEITP